MTEKVEYYRSQTNLYKKVIEDEIISENKKLACTNLITKETLYKYDFALGKFCIVSPSDHQVVEGIYWQISYFTFQVLLLYWKIFS